MWSKMPQSGKARQGDFCPLEPRLIFYSSLKSTIYNMQLVMTFASWVPAVNPARYAVELLYTNEARRFCDSINRAEGENFLEDQIRDSFGFELSCQTEEDSSVWPEARYQLWMLFGLGLALRLVAMVLMHVNDRNKKI